MNLRKRLKDNMCLLVVKVQVGLEHIADIEY